MKRKVKLLLYYGVLIENRSWHGCVLQQWAWTSSPAVLSHGLEASQGKCGKPNITKHPEREELKLSVSFFLSRKKCDWQLLWLLQSTSSAILFSSIHLHVEVSTWFSWVLLPEEKHRERWDELQFLLLQFVLLSQLVFIICFYFPI